MKNYLLNFAAANSTLVTGLSPTMVLFANMSTGATLVGPTITEAVSGWGLYTFQWGATTPIVFQCDGATSGLGGFRYIKGSLDPADRADEYGNTLVAIGNSGIALGITNVAIGTSIYALEQTLGSTLVAIGNSGIALGITNVAIGTSIYALEQTLGSTLVGIGNTVSAIGSTITGLGSSLNALIGTTASIIGDSSTDPSTLFGYLKRNLEITEGQQLFTKSSGAWNMLDRTGATTLRTRTITNSASTVIRA